MSIFINSRTLLITALLALFACVCAAQLTPAPVYAADPGKEFKGELCGGADFSLVSKSCGDGSPEESKVNKLVQTIVNVLSTIVGLLAVIFIIIGGFKYVTSGGDSGKITSARTTIVYSLIGLIIVALAQVLVRFVIAKATNS